MVTFKCVASGNTVSFSSEMDIKEMKKHDGYVEVPNKEVKVEKKESHNKSAK
jgi:hypothetical protein|tara:strand:- start:502 stop:657 length:156 start_codon:yes stop_codon:yes gene_type:complete